jgi:hypothetical protein
VGGEWATWWKEQAMGMWASAASLAPATVTCGVAVVSVSVALLLCGLVCTPALLWPMVASAPCGCFQRGGCM